MPLDPATIAAGAPRIVWIELTSKCPFDCVFCSRKLVRGAGEHMDFDLYRKILAQLDRPDTLRLNYSGESIHYPQLIEAVRLAKSTGATVELVTALASSSMEILRGLVDAGLDRLSISIHTLDTDEYDRIYRFGSLAALQQKVREVIAFRDASGATTPAIDFAFVAMDSNLPQLETVTAFARKVGIEEIAVHPVIRREPGMVRFPAELDEDDQIRPAFAGRVTAEVDRLRQEEPGIDVYVARPVDAPQPRNGLTTCEQNPWETAHILANGDVVVCEVTDSQRLGNLCETNLKDVWQGAAYRTFRGRYLDGEIPACQSCPWRKTAAVEDLSPVLTAAERGSAQFVRGWHAAGEDNVLWSRQCGAMVLARDPMHPEMHIDGMLPPGPNGEANVLALEADGRLLGEVDNTTSELQAFRWQHPLEPSEDKLVTVSFAVKKPYVPSHHGAGPDSRELGFALVSAGRVPQRQPARLVRPAGPRRVAALFNALALLDAVPALGRGRCLPAVTDAFGPGISVLIPERGNPQLLYECLDAVKEAANRVTEPVDGIVVVSGSPEPYAALESRHPWVRFLYSRQPLDFSSAIRKGLEQVTRPWVYLLNNDMVLEPKALQNVLACRASNAFSIGSQIFLRDPHRRRVETNWTRLSLSDGLVELHDIEPGEDPAVRDSAYSGGGCSLFRTSLLRAALHHVRGYAPFYWEDVEWGTLALRHGYRNLFCPASKAHHGYRSTVRRYYAEPEIERIFERNGLLFQLRNIRHPGSMDALRQRVESVHGVTRGELLDPLRVAGVLRARWRNARLPEPESSLFRLE